MKARLALPAFLAALALCVPAHAQDAPERLVPATNWNLDYAEDSCGLSRTFGEGDAAVLLQMRQYAPGAPLSVTVASRRALDTRVDPEIHFGPVEVRTSVMTPMELTLDDGFSGVRAQVDTGVPAATRSALAAEDAVRDEAENALQWLMVEDVFAQDVRLETGSLHPALSALRDCQASLLEYWELDAEAHRTLARDATVNANENWVETALRRMPEEAMVRARASHQYVLLDTDAAGGITRCRALSPNTNDDFAQNFCELAIERGSATPALDASGRPIASVAVLGMGIRTTAESFYSVR